MTREDAYYFKLLLTFGFHSEYEEWLERRLEEDSELDHLILNLSFCGSDLSKAILYLNDYCQEQKFDDGAVCERLRVFLKNAYNSNGLDKKEIISYMYKFSVNHIYDDSFDDIWYNMYYLHEYYSLAEDGITSWEYFDFSFFSYLNDGIPLSESGDILKSKPKKSIFQKIKMLFKRL